MTLPQLLFFYLVGAAPIVLVTTFLAHADDAMAFRRYPRRLFSFVFACSAVVGVVLLAQRFFLP